MTAVVVENHGTIEIAEGVTGSLWVVGTNNGTIVAPAGFTVSADGFAEQQVSQTLTLRKT